MQRFRTGLVFKDLGLFNHSRLESNKEEEKFPGSGSRDGGSGSKCRVAECKSELRDGSSGSKCMGSDCKSKFRDGSSGSNCKGSDCRVCRFGVGKSHGVERVHALGIGIQVPVQGFRL